MEIVISKLLPVFVYPLGLSILIVLLALAALQAGKTGLAKLLVLLVLLGLFIPSMPAVSEQLLRSLEMDHPPLPVDEYPSAGAIVVLSGGVAEARPVSLEARPDQTFDRLYQGYQLYQAEKAPTIVLSGGSISWRTQAAALPEAVLMAEILGQLGVPEARILVEGTSRNTRENAVFSKKLLEGKNIDTILLCTSALHMPRALACFRKTGLKAVPAPANFLTQVTDKTTFLDFLPHAAALDESTAVMKEYIGMAYYSLRGWM